MPIDRSFEKLLDGDEMRINYNYIDYETKN